MRNKTITHYTTDTQMLLLIELLKTYGIIRFDSDFCDAIGLLKQNLVNIKNKKNHFTPEHIKNAITSYKVDANWIFGISDNIFLGNKNGNTHKKNEVIINKSE